MYASKIVGKNKVIPVADKEELTEDNVQVAAVRFVAGGANPLESDSDREEMEAPKDTAKTKGARRRALKSLHKKEEHTGPETAPAMDMYLRVKQLSLFPSIY